MPKKSRKSGASGASETHPDVRTPAETALPAPLPVPVDPAGLDAEGSLPLVPLTAIELRPQPRKHFDPAELEALADLIFAHGLEQAITAEIQPAEGGGVTYLVRVGERRYRAFRLLRERWLKEKSDDKRWNRYQGYSVIPVVPKEVVPDPLRSLLQIAENEGRTGLTLYERSQALVEALQQTGLTSAEFARRYMPQTKGAAEVKLSHARRVVRIASENPTALALLEKSLLSDPEAVALFARLPAEKQEALARKAEALAQPLGRIYLAKLGRSGKEPSPPSAAGRRSPVVSLRRSWLQPIVTALEESGSGGETDALEQALVTLRALLSGAGGRVTFQLLEE
ncbi:MAG TPA: ParB/RepB/Spo0J family partition protein [Thermoanaerobaculia bacterium]|jgi:ParB-like chromosome segregation protein Spo0J|nr:ParB/RepB/Spo0J family partition protein [Thermoanaerobaculia bacterium]